MLAVKLSKFQQNNLDMKRILIYFLLTTPFLLTGCEEENNTDVKSKKDIIEIAQESGFTSLAEALTQVDLVSTLKGDGPFTVFAPTNEAFDNLLKAIGQKSIKDVPNDVLSDILLYHVISGSVSSGEVKAGDVKTQQGTDVKFSVDNGNIKVNDSKVISPFDVVASNGIIHTVDAVLVPESIAQFVNTLLEPAYFNVGFTTLIEAAVKADLVNTLLTTPNLTVFAPTNDAFKASGIVVKDTEKDKLVSVLKYHVVGAKVLSKDIPANAETLKGDDIYFSKVTSGNFINGDITITAVDIESGTGVVHVIDKVLVPAEGTVVDVAVNLSKAGSFTSLVAALQRTADEEDSPANLITVLSGTGPYTVFAPTDDAFTALIESEEDWDKLGDIPIATLVDVLKYHVVAARAYDKDLAGAVDESNKIATVEGTALTFDLANLKINTSTGITGVNTHATNGVIHVIDAVLVPDK